MRGLIFEDRLRYAENLTAPEPEPGEALIDVTMAGICNTDLEITRGYAGFRGVPGHEFVGVVAQAPDPELIGARVCGEINAGCGRCTWCATGLTRHCPNRTALGIKGRDGAFAEHLVLPCSNLLRVPAGVPDMAAVFTEPLAAAFEILEQVHLPPGQECLVIGDGKLGSLIAQVLALHSAAVTMLGHHRTKMLPLIRKGITITEVMPDRRFPLVVEATGSPSGFERARTLTQPRGTLILKSTYAAETTVNLAPLVVDEISVVGSRCGPFAPAMALLERGAIDVRELIEAIYPLEDGVQAFAHAARRGARKVLIRVANEI